MKIHTHRLYFYAILFTLLSSCSLKYGMTIHDETSVPEFIFDNVTYDKYEDNKKSMSLNAEKLEQYKDGKSMYAKELNFKIYDNSNTDDETTEENIDKIKTEGKCGLLAADTKDEKYTLYDDIEINNKNDDLTVKADSLKWNGKSEQLTSGRNDVVSIQKGKTLMKGSGFSASGVTKQFSFSGNISGQTLTGTSEEDTEIQENEENTNEIK